MKEIWIIADELRSCFGKDHIILAIEDTCKSHFIEETLHYEHIYTGHFSDTQNEGRKGKSDKIKILAMTSQFFASYYYGGTKRTDSEQVAGIIYTTHSQYMGWFEFLLKVTCPNGEEPNEGSYQAPCNPGFRNGLKSSPWYQNGCPFVYFRMKEGELDLKESPNELFEKYGVKRYYSTALSYKEVPMNSQKLSDVSDLLNSFIN